MLIKHGFFTIDEMDTNHLRQWYFWLIFMVIIGAEVYKGSPIYLLVINFVSIANRMCVGC